MATSIVAKGKTKTLESIPDEPDFIEAINWDQITAGDGARKDSFLRKGEFSTETNHHVFVLLQRCGVPVAYESRTSLNSFRAQRCTMLPYEVVAMRSVTPASSFRKRDPRLVPGTRLTQPQTAFFLKTTDRRFGEHLFEKDDPFISSYGAGGIEVCRPDVPKGESTSTFVTTEELCGVDNSPHPYLKMDEIVRWVFLILESSWAMQGCTLCDIKIEFGFTTNRELVVADVIDNDSWRLLNEKGEHLDKQRYRDKDTPLEEIARLYEEVAYRSRKLSQIDDEEWFFA